jgi:hypothetical protein
LAIGATNSQNNKTHKDSSLEVKIQIFVNLSGKAHQNAVMQHGSEAQGCI